MDGMDSMPDAPRTDEYPEQVTAVVTGVVPMAELRNFFDRAFQELSRYVAEGGIDPAGPALALYRGVPGETVDVEVGFPVRGQVAPSGPVVAGRIPASRVVTCVHRGDYDGLGASWTRLAEWAQEHELVLTDRMWEVYVTEPRPGADPADMVTRLFWALRE